MIHGYPYTDFHELNLDYILSLCRSSMGLHLEQADKFLKLVNAQGDEISKLQVYYAQTALQDDIGNNIDAYIIRSAVSGDNLVFTRGNGEAITLTVPYAVKASKDIRNNDILDYIKNISVTGTDLIITNGNNDSYSITVPYAVNAKEDVNGKDITTYVADITTGNDKLIVKDSTGNIIREITVPYAVKAKEDVNGEDITATYGALITADVTTISLRSKDNTILSTITVPYAIKALSDNQGNEFLSDYGYNLAVDGNKVALNAHDGSMLNEITVPFAVLATDATNAIESVQISGDEVVFTTHGGQSTRLIIPYAVKALKDNLNNTLSETYIANAVNDPNTGKITFYAQDGSIIAEMIPTVDSAVHDAQGNVIADYIKTIVVDNQSNYVTVTHGTGVTDTLVINYANKAWKDTYDNVIGNTYIRRLACEQDADTGHYVIVAYNGELSELFRFEVYAYRAQIAETDVNGKDLTDYVTDVDINVSKEVEVTHGDGTVDIIPLPTDELNDLSDVNITAPADGNYLSYDGNSSTWINKVLPTIPTVDAVSYIIQLTFTGWTYFNLLKPSGATLTVNSKKVYRVNSRTSVQQITTAVNLDDIFHKGGRVYVVYNNQTQVFEVTEDYRVSQYGKMFRAHGNNGICDIVFEMDNTLTNTNIKAYVVPTFNALTISGGERQTIPTITYDTVNDTVTLDGLDYTFSSYSDFFVNGCKMPQAYIKVDNGAVREGVYVPSMWYISDAAGNIIKDANNHYMSLARFFDTYKNDTTTQFKLNFVYFVYDSNNVIYRVKVSYIFFNSTATQVAFGSIGIDLQSFTVSKG